jgi:hypothetical protein
VFVPEKTFKLNQISAGMAKNLPSLANIRLGLIVSLGTNT